MILLNHMLKQSVSLYKDDVNVKNNFAFLSFQAFDKFMLYLVNCFVCLLFVFGLFSTRIVANDSNLSTDFQLIEILGLCHHLIRESLKA